VADAHLFPSRDSVKADAARRYAAAKSIDFRWDTLRVQALGRDAGVVTGQARATIVGQDGKPAIVRAGATYVFSRRDGQWRVVHGHASHALMSR
jgi:ketosteroid isomerase-like protein